MSDLKDRFNTYKSNLNGALQESRHIVTSYPKRFKEKSIGGQSFSIAKISLAPLSIYLTSGTSLSTVSVLGAFALSSVFVMLRMENNKHKNAMGAPIAFSLCAQKLMLGATGYAVMAGIAGTRGLVMAMMPDTKESEPLRNRIALGFGIVGMGSIGAIAYFKQELWELAPMASMLLGTYASSKINEKSFQARACHVIANTNNALYSLIFSGSAGAAMIDATGASLAGTTIAENDIPQKRKNGKALSAFEKVKAYASTLKNADSRNDYIIPEVEKKKATAPAPARG